MFPCPLCQHPNTEFYFEDKRRSFSQCKQCELVFVDPAFLPDPSVEKAEYDLHQNSFNDEGYRRFLNRIAEPLYQRLSPGATGLDFGCGPAPVLASMMAEKGFPTECYDPFFFSNESLLHKKFDFVTCTEAIEHFHAPHREWKILLSMLKPGGILAIMTKRVVNKQRFASWHYKNDKTHVSFFSDSTFTWLADNYDLNLEIEGDDVVFFRIKSRP